MFFEKRKFVRFALHVSGKGNTLVYAFVDKQKYECSVIDISLGGMRLQFIVNEDVDLRDKPIRVKGEWEGGFRFEKDGLVRWQKRREFGMMFRKVLLPEELERVLDVVGF